MYLPKLYESGASSLRIRYAIATILRDRLVNEGAFTVCFEMGDEDLVIRTILRRGLRNPRLRVALERSHLIDLTSWLARYPEMAEAYHATAVSEGPPLVMTGIGSIDRRAPAPESGPEESQSARCRS